MRTERAAELNPVDDNPDDSWVLADPGYMPDPGILHLRQENEGAEGFEEWEVTLKVDGIVKAAHRQGLTAHVYAEDWRSFALDSPGLYLHISGLPKGESVSTKSSGAMDAAELILTRRVAKTFYTLRIRAEAPVGECLNSIAALGHGSAELIEFLQSDPGSLIDDKGTP